MNYIWNDRLPTHPIQRVKNDVVLQVWEANIADEGEHKGYSYFWCSDDHPAIWASDRFSLAIYVDGDGEQLLYDRGFRLGFLTELQCMHRVESIEELQHRFQSSARNSNYHSTQAASG